ncbi:MAG TPA: hypothetical protein VFP96_05640, partial [Candidatus Acidoferrum sp.]|nr:hypothetical protein [Candidatus Acidoferrum sp.]
GHQRQITSYPSKGICAEERTPVPRLHASAAEISSHPLNPFEQFAACDRYKLLAMYFTQYDAIGSAPQLTKNGF